MSEFSHQQHVLARLNVPPTAQEYPVEENRKLKLYKAAISGNWGKAEAIFRNHPQDITRTTTINQLGETALHIATAEDHTKFVKQLVSSMSAEDLATRTVRGDTAFFYAAVCGHMKTARIMLKKNPALATIRGGGGEENMLPIRAAALHRHSRMVRSFYKDGNYESGDDKCDIDVLIALIDSGDYDIAIQMVSEKPSLAAEATNRGETALSAFARKPRITYKLIDIFFMDNILVRINEYFRTQGFKLLKLVLQPLRNSMLIKEALFVAARQGNWEFLTTLLHSDPTLAFEVDENHYTIFHIAVLHRDVKVFNIIHETYSIKNVVKMMKDKDGNNILHLAGKMPLIRGVEVVPGAALQLQRELRWFEEVRKMVGAHEMKAKNGDGKTPRELFAAEHEGLREKGEQWMKATANSCMVVSTLVAGVAFVSSITVPGGNKGDTGVPNLLHSGWFNFFIVMNGLSLIFSASSILFFLAVFTSHYSMADFKKSLPMKFILGLILLSGAVQAMIIAFIAALFIIFERAKAYAYSIAGIPAFTFVFFIFLLIPLFLQVIYSTFTGFFQFTFTPKIDIVVLLFCVGYLFYPDILLFLIMSGILIFIYVVKYILSMREAYKNRID